MDALDLNTYSQILINLSLSDLKSIWNLNKQAQIVGRSENFKQLFQQKWGLSLDQWVRKSNYQLFLPRTETDLMPIPMDGQVIRDFVPLLGDLVVLVDDFPKTPVRFYLVWLTNGELWHYYFSKDLTTIKKKQLSSSCMGISPNGYLERIGESETQVYYVYYDTDQDLLFKPEFIVYDFPETITELVWTADYVEYYEDDYHRVCVTFYLGESGQIYNSEGNIVFPNFPRVKILQFWGQDSGIEFYTGLIGLNQDNQFLLQYLDQEQATVWFTPKKPVKSFRTRYISNTVYPDSDTLTMDMAVLYQDGTLDIFKVVLSEQDRYPKFPNVDFSCYSLSFPDIPSSIEKIEIMIDTNDTFMNEYGIVDSKGRLYRFLKRNLGKYISKLYTPIRTVEIIRTVRTTNAIYGQI